MPEPMPTDLRDRWRAIAAFHAELESPDFSAGRWRGGEREGDTI